MYSFCAIQTEKKEKPHKNGKVTLNILQYHAVICKTHIAFEISQNTFFYILKRKSMSKAVIYHTLFNVCNNYLQLLICTLYFIDVDSHCTSM